MHFTPKRSHAGLTINSGGHDNIVVAALSKVPIRNAVDVFVPKALGNPVRMRYKRNVPLQHVQIIVFAKYVQGAQNYGKQQYGDHNYQIRKMHHTVNTKPARAVAAKYSVVEIVTVHGDIITYNAIFYNK